MTILVTGGAGFIGANFVLDWLAACDEPVINLDKLTYAGNPETLASLQGDARHQLVQGDIGDVALVSRLLAEYRPRAEMRPKADGSYASQITYVTDRPGHDCRYAMTPASSKPSWAGSLPRPLRPAFARRWSGIWPTPSGWPMCKAGPTASGCKNNIMG
jgi:dTDP-D-glucose 4,6-dehydratase